MSFKTKTPNSPYIYKSLISICIVSIATVLQYYIWVYIQPAPFLIYFPAVMLSCLYGNGFLAIVLSIYAAQFMFVQPFIDFSFTWPHDVIRHIVFFIGTFGIKILVDKAMSSKAKAELAVLSLKEEKTIRELFVSTLSHDLQTPLTSIKLTTQSMLKYPTNDQAQHLQRVLSNITRIENMIRNLLDSNQITAGMPLPVKLQNIELVEVVENTLKELKNIYGERFDFMAPPAVWGHWAPDAIQRILENLCSNAVKYGNENTPITIDVSYNEVSVNLSVHNWGDIISKEDQVVLFDTFLRLKSAKSRSIKGWGLGLTLVKGLVDAMNGSITITSREDLGTTFNVHLPRYSKTLTIENTDTPTTKSM